jgi:hypothetical protein
MRTNPGPSLATTLGVALNLGVASVVAVVFTLALAPLLA